jgi:hypothetical protein
MERKKDARCKDKRNEKRDTTHTKLKPKFKKWMVAKASNGQTFVDASIFQNLQQSVTFSLTGCDIHKRGAHPPQTPKSQKTQKHHH